MTAVDSKQLVLIGGYKESDDAIYKEIAIFHTGTFLLPPSFFLFLSPDGTSSCADDTSWHWVSPRIVGQLMPAVRSGHSATLVEGDGLLICGGWKPDYLQPAYWLDLRMT